MGRGPSHRLAGITLVETIVMIAIVSTLVMLLIPVLKQARLAAQKVQCQSNLRQLNAINHSYAADSRDRLAPIKQQTYYFYHAGVRNLGVYYKAGYFRSVPLMFCPNAPTGFGDIDVAHQGFNLFDYRPGKPQPFNGPYQACSYQRRSMSAKFDWREPEAPLNWNWDGTPSPGAADDAANYSFRMSSATSSTAMLADVFQHYGTYLNTIRHPAYLTIGHNFELNRAYGDGSVIARNDFGRRVIAIYGSLYTLEHQDWGATGWPWQALDR
jgi:hypothetical protein